jgi:hypothetical protein
LLRLFLLLPLALRFSRSRRPRASVEQPSTAPCEVTLH